MKPTALLLLAATVITLSALAAAITILSETTRLVVKENTTADCRPVCIREDLNSQGWYYSCNKTLIKYSHCQNCGLACMNARNAFEGWYDTCTYKSIIYTDCNTTVKKTQTTMLVIQVTSRATTTTTKISGTGISSSLHSTTTTRTTTTTTMQPTTTIAATTTTLASTILPAGIKPVCMAKTPQLKGWFNPTTGQLIRKASCSHCNPVCLTTKKTPGWYDGCNSNFIIAATCA